MNSDEKLTIVNVLYARPHIGGSGRMGIEIAIELARRGHDVHIVSYPNTYLSSYEASFLKIHPIDDIRYGAFKVPPTGLTLPGKIAVLAEDMNIDVLHAHYGVTHGEAVIDSRDIIIREMVRGKLLNQKREPIAVITNHGTDITINGHKESMAPGLELRLSQADGITFVSEYLQKEAQGIFDLDDYGTVIYNFVDERRFCPDSSGQANKRIRNELEIPLDATVFYHASNFRPNKNIGSLIKAMQIVTKEMPNKNVYLLLCGDGPERKFVEQQVRDYNLSHRVRFAGVIDPENMPEYHQAGDVHVLCSLTESSPLANLEAMHTANPILASNKGGIPEAIVHGINGYLFNPENPKAIALYMTRLAQNPKLRERMGAEAKRIVTEKFNREKIVNQYENYFYQLLNEKTNILLEKDNVVSI